MRLLLVLMAVIALATTSCNNELTDLEKRWQIAKDSTSFEAYFRIALDYRNSPYFDSACYRMNRVLRTCSLMHFMYSFTNENSSINLCDESYKSYVLATYLDTIHHCNWCSEKYNRLERENIKARNSFDFNLIGDSIAIRNRYFSNEIALWDTITDFFYNPCDKYHLSDKKDVFIETIGMSISHPKAVFYISSDLSSSDTYSSEKWRQFFEIIDMILLLQDEYRNRSAYKLFKKRLHMLPLKDQALICEKFGIYLKIQFFTYNWETENFKELLVKRKGQSSN